MYLARCFFLFTFLLATSCDTIIPDNHGVVYVWAKTFGGNEYDWAWGTASDGNGNIYLAGEFSDSADFNPGVGIDNKLSAGGEDAFLTKINADGTYAWTKTFGGIGDDFAYGLTVDLNGNIFIVGEFIGTADFDPESGIDNRTSAGFTDAFLVKINADGDTVKCCGRGKHLR